MRIFNGFLILLCLFIVANCANKGVESTTPEPLPEVAVEIIDENEDTYILTSNGDGTGMVQDINEYGEIVEEVPVIIYVDIYGNFHAEADFSNDKHLEIEGSINEDGEVTLTRVSVDGEEDETSSGTNSSARGITNTSSETNYCEESLVAHWRFDEEELNGEIDSLIDETGAHNASPTPELITSNDSILGRAIEFPNIDSSDRIILDNLYINHSFTISAWFLIKNIDDMSTEQFIFRQSNTLGDRGEIKIYVDPYDQRLSFSITDISNSEHLISQENLFELDEWHNIVATFDGSAQEMKLYIDNTFVSSKSTSQAIMFSLKDTYIGHIGTKFTGKMDEFMIFDSAIDTTEIEEIYFNGLDEAPHCK